MTFMKSAIAHTKTFPLIGADWEMPNDELRSPHFDIRNSELDIFPAFPGQLFLWPCILPSPLVALERSTAVHRDPANAGRRFIPLLLGDKFDRGESLRSSLNAA